MWRGVADHTLILKNFPAYTRSRIGGAIMNVNIKTLAITAVTALAFAVGGCNTVQGVGDDLKSAGKKGEEVIDKTIKKDDSGS